jgi:hypothetical protein
MTFFRRMMIAGLAALMTVNAAITNCGVGKSAFEVNGLGFWPDPPIAGENATLSFGFTVPDGMTITDGTSQYSYTLNYIPLPGNTNPLCNDVPCPITPGFHNLTSTAAWPTGVSGKLVTTINWYDLAKNLLMCVQLTTKT